MDASTTTAKSARGRPHKTTLTADELLSRRAVLALNEFYQIVGIDRSTALHKEREGVLPARRIVAGRNVFLSAEVKAWLAGAPASEGADPDRSRRSREIALARSARGAA